jgi:hypothetical protein
MSALINRSISFARSFINNNHHNRHIDYDNDDDDLPIIPREHWYLSIYLSITLHFHLIYII